MSREDFPKAYEAKQHEDHIYQEWEKSCFFNPDNLSGDPYTIPMPPPNVTGILHLGHALENALMDTMARFQRLRGKRVLLLPGTDHAAIATQAKVEKLLIEQGMNNPRQELGREKLLEKIRAFANEHMSVILGQIRKMGTSCDWSRLAYTFDEKRNRAVNELFCRMYQDGLIYRGYRVVNWSVKGQSTCSDDEIEYIERPAKLYTFKYAPDFPIAIASTRPETKLGDTAVAVHPTDVRYAQFIGKIFTVDVGAKKPLEIKIIADENVDPDFGTGAVGVTPAHSPIDFAMYEKQKAANNPIRILPVIGQDGRMTEEAGIYKGLLAEEAREKFVARLKEQSLLEKEEEITQNVGTSDRYGDVLESIPMTQWWLDVNKIIPNRGKSLRDLMREAVTTGLNSDASQKVTITPDRFTKLYLDRVEHLRDWCLSRQLWWGHRIPVWYRGDEMFVGTSAPKGDGWAQDEDTLDTWFSSGSWTFSTLSWPAVAKVRPDDNAVGRALAGKPAVAKAMAGKPEQTNDLTEFHPTSWIQMGYEILYLWLMRMVLMSTYILKEIPFKDAYIHGMVCDQQGKKFSKSSGNGIDPIEVIDAYGCDALRISLLIGISPGNDSRYYNEKIESGRNFVNKLWNISRFIFTSVSEVKRVSESELQPQTLADRWILSRFSRLQQEVTTYLETFEFSQAGEKLRDFTWNEFADWYLEIAKIQKTDGTEKILLFILEHLLVFWHPFMPFVTEVLWSYFPLPNPPDRTTFNRSPPGRLSDRTRFGRGGESKGVASEKKLLMVHSWPDLIDKQDIESEQTFSVLRQMIIAVRNIRSEYRLDPQKRVPLSIVAQDASAHDPLLGMSAVIETLGRVSSIDWTTTQPTQRDAATAIVGPFQLSIPLAEMIDWKKERARLEKEQTQLVNQIERLDKELDNHELITKAPAHVIESMRQKQTLAKEQLTALQSQLEKINI